MNRRRLLALVLAVGLVGIVATPLLIDAGYFLGWGVIGLIESTFGIFFFLSQILLVMLMLTLLSDIETLFTSAPGNVVIRKSLKPLSNFERRADAISKSVLLCLCVSYMAAEITRWVYRGWWFSPLSLESLNPYPTNPLFIILIWVFGWLLGKLKIMQAPLERSGFASTKAESASKTEKSKKEKQKSHPYYIFLVALIVMIAGAEKLAPSKTVLLFFFAGLVADIVGRNPQRMIQLGWTVAFLLICALGVAVFDQALTAIEAASGTV